MLLQESSLQRVQVEIESMVEKLGSCYDTMYEQ